MSISFACPECKAQIEVGDEFAGLSGQCPRCEKVIVIPSPNLPKARPAGASTSSAPPPDAWAEPRSARRDEPRGRRRRPPPAPKEPAGPLWPWLLGIAGAVAVTVLLFSSFFVLVLWRRPAPTRLAPVAVFKNNALNPGEVVVVGQLDGKRAIMQDGVFQIRSQLQPDDRRDPEHPATHCKRYEIQLQANTMYTFELDSNQFNCEVRVESLKDDVLAQSANLGMRNARTEYQPFETKAYFVYASSMQPAFGNFTLTVREANRPKPFVP